MLLRSSFIFGLLCQSLIIAIREHSLQAQNDSNAPRLIKHVGNDDGVIWGTNKLGEGNP